MAEQIILPELQLESGRKLTNVSVAYDTWGKLNAAGDNAVIICHALTGNTRADVWWGPLIGPGAAFDTDRLFVVCLNVLGSPYGSASPLTINPETGAPYGVDFPPVTIRDTVRAHRLALEEIGVQHAVLATGGSMGGMQALEWAFEGDFVHTVAPIAVGGKHSSWCIGFSEAQRQAIYADPRWKDGMYDEQPSQGLATARMIAMLSYRSRGSFEARFGRAPQDGQQGLFAVESYLRYQGEKLVDRFDASCYVHLTKQMDTHDVGRDRSTYREALASIHQKMLVIGIDSDILYPLDEQRELTEFVPNARLEVIESPHGHDAFLIEFKQVEEIFRKWLRETADAGGRRRERVSAA